MTKYQTLKVYNIIHFPPEVLEYFDNAEYSGERFTILEVCDKDFEDYSILDGWLLENGAVAGDFVLIGS